MPAEEVAGNYVRKVNLLTPPVRLMVDRKELKQKRQKIYLFSVSEGEEIEYQGTSFNISINVQSHYWYPMEWTIMQQEVEEY